MASLRSRPGEVLESLEAEAMSDEAVFLSTDDGVDHLYIYSRARDLEQAAAIFQESARPVDVEFKDVIQTCLDLESVTPLELAFAADLGSRLVL